MEVSMEEFLAGAADAAARRHGLHAAVVHPGSPRSGAGHLPGAATLFWDAGDGVHPSLLGPSQQPLTVASTEEGLAEIASRALLARGRSCDFVREVLPRDRLRTDVPVGSLWTPDPYLARRAEGWPISRVLDLGCGSGRDAVFLAQIGHRISAIDRLPDAVELGRHRAALVGVQVDWRVGDVRALDPTQLTAFDVLVAVRLQRPSVVLDLAKGLAPGGRLLLRGLSRGGPKSGHLRYRKAEIEAFMSSGWAPLDGPRIVHDEAHEWLELEARRL